jgi:hypothetical protein
MEEYQELCHDGDDNDDDMEEELPSDENDEDDDEIDYGLRQVLPVAEKPQKKMEVNSEWFPTTGEEYLLWVRQQAKRYPKISISKSSVAPTTTLKIPKRTASSKPTETPIPQDYLPSKEWLDMVLKDFDRVRDYLELYQLEQTQKESSCMDLRLHKHPVNERGWYEWCYQDHQASILKKLLSLDQKQAWLLLEYHLKWLQPKHLIHNQIKPEKVSV